MRNYRLEAELSSRETDNRNPEDMVGWKATVLLPSRERSETIRRNKAVVSGLTRGRWEGRDDS